MNLDNIYTELILEHSRNKHNRRELEDYTKKELGHNPSCGDEITLEVKIQDDTIEDISYTGHGCAISQASTSIMCDNVKGIKVEEAIERADKFIGMVKGEIDDPDKLEDLDDAIAFESISTLPARVKCAVLSWYTLKNMLENNEDKGSFNLS
ncbi:SUF system NifU family Fe-S cluster assembly protein [Peptoniphilus harei]|uniref:NifU-like protein n=1 Tax=Peptoniphilus harei TaxID=54005 RepID=A0A2X1Y073_9FIRM|nr:SUF system NifU family Fe-S cluster assembly protein [Peptoniphilus harei]MDU1642283.1 SUF system NifU family Fe-S cluster assembly protein [Peptoniphilus harei]QQT90682.1 SUF system NifU family Fe-S cluster assembly protein [Peptoniphilus harei]SPY48283.1 NifU-like protein [Peptoniphilus harei]